jgi:hypothetical protein
MKANLKSMCCGVMLLGMLSASVLPAAASGNARSEHEDHECSITVDYHSEEDPIKGAEFEIYRAADITDDGEYEISPEFAEAGVSLDDEYDSDLSDCAVTLETYILEKENEGDEIEPVGEGYTDENGKLIFDELGEGLYLLVGETHTDEENMQKYIPLASLITLPDYDDCEEEEVSEIYDLIVEPKFEIMPLSLEEEPVDVTVQKVWEDSGYEDERPESVDVVLFCDGEKYDTVSLSADNDWKYEWKNLDGDSRWQLIEENVPEGYTMTSVQNSYSFTVTNTVEKPDEPDDSSVPDSSSTPDTSSVPDSSSTPDTTSTPDSSSTPDTSSRPDTPTTSTPSTTSTPGTTSTPDQGVPNTGQTWWTVSVLTFVGLLLIVLGWNTGKKTDKDKR